MDAATFVSQARRAAGLSQRELAARAGVPQSAVARIERRQQVPRSDTLSRILDACGFTLRLMPDQTSDVDREQIRAWLALTPPERARGIAAYGRFLDRMRAARKVG